MLLPRIKNEARRARAHDELPQSAAGRTIMTTEPKFIPEKAVKIDLSGGGSFKARLIDCVGYMVDGALGHEENEAPRLVKVPGSTTKSRLTWQPKPAPAASSGSTPPSGWSSRRTAQWPTCRGKRILDAERRIIAELNDSGKPICHPAQLRRARQ